jgi:hypothetical protein
MALINRQRRLADRLPADVRERVQRAGAREIDWYAGRRPGAASPARTGISRTPSADAEELRKLLAEHRRAPESDREHAGVVAIMVTARRLVARVFGRPRAAGL